MAKQDPPKKGSKSSKAQPPKDDYKAGIKQWFIDYYNSPAFRENYLASHKLVHPSMGRSEVKEMPLYSAPWEAKRTLKESDNWYGSDKASEDRFKTAKSRILAHLPKIVDTENPHGDPDAEASYSSGTINLRFPKAEDRIEVYAHEVSHQGDDEIIPSTPNLGLFAAKNNPASRFLKEDNVDPKSPRYQYLRGLENVFKPRYEELFKKATEERLKKNPGSFGLMGEGFENEFGSLNQLYGEGRIGNYRGLTSYHDMAHGENRGDLMGLRNLAARKGIWDITKSKPGTFTKEMLDKLYRTEEVSKPVLEHFPAIIGQPRERTRKSTAKRFIDNLKDKYGEDGLIWLMNYMAKNDRNNSEEKYA